MKKRNGNNLHSKIIDIAKEIIPSNKIKLTSIRKHGSDVYFLLAEDENYFYKVEFLLTENGYKLLLFDYEEKIVTRVK